MLELILVAIFLLCVGFIFNEGLWGACILLFNVLLAATLAVNFFEPMANWLESMAPSYTFLCDIVAIWVCFAAAFVVLRLITGVLSRHRVRFKRPVDLAGGVFLFRLDRLDHGAVHAVQFPRGAAGAQFHGLSGKARLADVSEPGPRSKLAGLHAHTK